MIYPNRKQHGSLSLLSSTLSTPQAALQLAGPGFVLSAVLSSPQPCTALPARLERSGGKDGDGWMGANGSKGSFLLVTLTPITMVDDTFDTYMTYMTYMIFI